MSTMSRSNSGQGFSVSQPTFNSPLQFCPALGTQQLDDLINAYVPGSASIQEKRAVVSMDFFNYSHTTGESFRYYSVPAATSSASSSPLMDSAFNSSFVSPALSNWSWSQSASASTPASSFTPESAPRAKPAKKASSSSSRASPPDFSHLPGMKIMTKDGRDVTNSASRGCKTKEQRDHAHLMRIIKACDACKKKKIRCDPSHKKRSSGPTPASQTPAPSTSRTKASAKRKQPTVPEPQIPSPQDFMSSTVPSFPQDSLFADFDLSQMDSMAQDWDAFVQYDDEPMGLVPADYDFFLDPAGYFTESSNSASPSSPSAQTRARAARAPALQAGAAQGGEAFVGDLHQTVSDAPALPYMDAGVPGNDYMDFNLFSPATSFVDDDSLPVTDIGMASSVDAYASLPDSAFLDEPLQAYSSGNRGERVSVGGQNVERQQFVRRRDRPEDVVRWDEDVRLEGMNANVPVLGGAENASNTAAASDRGLAHYATPPRPEPDLPPRTSQLVRQDGERNADCLLTCHQDVQRAVVDAPHTSADVSSSPRPGSRTDGASRRPVSSPSCSRGGSGADLVVVPFDSPGSFNVQHAPRASGNQSTPSWVSSTSDTVTSPTISATQGNVSSSSGLSTGVPGNNSSWVNDGLSRDVTNAPQTVSPVQEAAVARAEQSTHNITAMVALGVLATGIPAVLAVSLVQLALGVMVLGAIFSPKSTKLAFPEQRIRGTTPLPSTTYQEERQGLLTLARSYAASWVSRPTAHHHHPCRQMEYAHPVSAVGRLATSRRLLALTQ